MCTCTIPNNQSEGTTMDIAQIQRTNQMAKDLLDKGVASSMEEGMRIAENIVGRGEGIPQATGPAGATPVPAPFTVSLSDARVTGSFPAAPASTVQANSPMPNTDVDTQLRTLNFRLNEQARHIGQLQHHVAELNAKLTAAHAQMATRPQPRVISEPAPSGQTQLVHQPETQTVTIINASTGESVSVAAAGEGNGDSTAKRLHARVGAYTSDDVSIEKMFYCGGK